MTRPRRCPTPVHPVEAPLESPGVVLEQIRAHFAAAREELGYSCGEAAAHLGVVEGVIRHFESGRTTPPLGRLLRYAAIVHIPRRQILSPIPSPTLDRIVSMLEQVADPTLYDVLEPLIAHLLTYASVPPPCVSGGVNQTP